MKKIEKLYKWIQTNKKMAPSLFDSVLLICSLLVCAIALDIHEIFGFHFKYVILVSGFLFLTQVSYCFLWFIETFIIIIFCKISYHKTPKEFCESIDFARKEAEKYENK